MIPHPDDDERLSRRLGNITMAMTAMAVVVILAHWALKTLG